MRLADLLRRLRARRVGRRLRYAQKWAETAPYDSRADRYASPTGRADGPWPGDGGTGV